jgi:hypothetical protein
VTGLISSFIELNRTTANWTLHQYHVSFEPEVESARIRCILFRKNAGIFTDSKAFDGAMLFSTVKSPKDVIL